MLLVRFVFWHSPDCTDIAVRDAEEAARRAISKCFIIQDKRRIEVAGYPQIGRPSLIVFGQVTYEQDAAIRNPNAKQSCNKAIGKAMEEIFGEGYVKIAEIDYVKIVFDSMTTSAKKATG